MTRLVAIIAVAAAGCVIFQREVALPEGDGPFVLVGSAALVEPMNDLARHPWIAVKRPGGQWERWEVMCCPNSSPMSTVQRSNVDPLSDYGGGGGDVHVHGVFGGKRAAKMIECIEREGPRYPHRNTYRAWPGPNSNTFVDYMARACDIPVDLPATSIGKDHRGLIGVSWTAGGTGFQVETPIAGVKLGLTEGVEVHLFGLALGVDWWPPAIIVPLGPGRIGFDDR